MNDILNNETIEKNIRRRKRYINLKRLLLAANAIMPAVNIFISIYTIPYTATVSSPEIFSGTPAVYVICSMLLFFPPCVGMIIAAVLGIVPIRKTNYKQRLLVLFLVIWLLVQLLCLLQLGMEMHKGIGYA